MSKRYRLCDRSRRKCPKCQGCGSVWDGPAAKWRNCFWCKGTGKYVRYAATVLSGMEPPKPKVIAQWKPHFNLPPGVP
jgi:DnaJ-class molecular chaperone